jgi:outer membrane protein, adhesin transport system
MTSVRLLAVTAIALALSAPAYAESLTEAVQTTVSTHPLVSEVSNDRLAIDQELEQAHGLFRPQVDFRGDAGLGVSNRWGNGGTRVDDGDILPNAAAQLSLQQMLFDGFNAQAEEEKQKNRINSAANRVKETGELVGLRTTETYLNTLRARQLLEIADVNLKEHRTLLRDIERRARGGAGNKADVEQAKARVAQAEAARMQVEADLRSAEARYNSLVGKFPGDLSRPNIPMEYMPATEPAAVAAALADSPTVGVRAADVDVAGSELKQTKSSFYPTLDLEGSASRQKDLGGVKTTKDEAGLGVVMRWNLYRGGADTAREKEFQWRQAEAQSRLDAARREAEEDMRTSWAARDAARLRAERFAEQVNANEKVLVAYKKQFDAGERTLLDVLDAQNELFLSKSNMLTAYYTALFGDFTVLSNRGALLTSLNVTLPETAAVASEQSSK